MRSLPETQSLLIDALLHGGAERMGRAAALLRPSGDIAPARRLQVYRNNLLASLGDALDAVFPVVERLVGGACFASLARAFI
ncbi:MAG: DNA-binding domain-containing protein, partial [Rhizobacter sp.]